MAGTTRTASPLESEATGHLLGMCHAIREKDLKAFHDADLKYETTTKEMAQAGLGVSFYDEMARGYRELMQNKIDNGEI